jgi:hypothetical protein
VLFGAGHQLERPLRARIDFREPLDLGDPLELALTGDQHHLTIGFVADGRIKAAAAIDDTI